MFDNPNSYNPKISIIVPVYNVEKYLHRCLNSIIVQTFTNWECILVDDGSFDDSGNICEEYKVKDSRFKVVHKKNGGVSSARNYGIKSAKGEWIYFSDSDDELYPDCLESLLTNIENDTCLVMAGYDDIDLNGKQRNLPIALFNEKLTHEEAIRRLFIPKYYGYEGYLWCKLFKRYEIINKQLTFRENIAFNEDCLFILQFLLATTGSVEYTSKSVYRYCFNTTGAIGSTKEHFNKNFISDFDIFIEMLAILQREHCPKDVERAVKNRAISSFLFIQKMMKKDSISDETISSHLRGLLKEHIGYYFYYRRIVCFIYRKFNMFK